MHQSTFGWIDAVSGGAMTVTTVVTGGRGLASAFAGSAADQSSIIRMAIPAVPFVVIPDWVETGMTGIASGA